MTQARGGGSPDETVNTSQTRTKYQKPQEEGQTCCQEVMVPESTIDGN